MKNGSFHWFSSMGAYTLSGQPAFSIPSRNWHACADTFIILAQKRSMPSLNEQKTTNSTQIFSRHLTKYGAHAIHAKGTVTMPPAFMSLYWMVILFWIDLLGCTWWKCTIDRCLTSSIATQGSPHLFSCVGCLLQKYGTHSFLIR